MVKTEKGTFCVDSAVKRIPGVGELILVTHPESHLMGPLEVESVKDGSLPIVHARPVPQQDEDSVWVEYSGECSELE